MLTAQEKAQKKLNRLITFLTTNPPEGLDRADVEGFFTRKRADILVMMAGIFEKRAAKAARKAAAVTPQQAVSPPVSPTVEGAYGTWDFMDGTHRAVRSARVIVPLDRGRDVLIEDHGAVGLEPELAVQSLPHRDLEIAVQEADASFNLSGYQGITREPFLSLEIKGGSGEHIVKLPGRAGLWWIIEKRLMRDSPSLMNNAAEGLYSVEPQGDGSWGVRIVRRPLYDKKYMDEKAANYTAKLAELPTAYAGSDALVFGPQVNGSENGPVYFEGALPPGHLGQIALFIGPNGEGLDVFSLKRMTPALKQIPGAYVQDVEWSSLNGGWVEWAKEREKGVAVYHHAFAFDLPAGYYVLSIDQSKVDRNIFKNYRGSSTLRRCLAVDGQIGVLDPNISYSELHGIVWSHISPKALVAVAADFYERESRQIKHALESNETNRKRLKSGIHQTYMPARKANSGSYRPQPARFNPVWGQTVDYDGLANQSRTGWDFVPDAEGWNRNATLDGTIEAAPSSPSPAPPPPVEEVEAAVAEPPPPPAPPEPSPATHFAPPPQGALPDTAKVTAAPQSDLSWLAVPPYRSGFSAMGELPSEALFPDYSQGLLWDEVHYIFRGDSIDDFKAMLGELNRVLDSALKNKFEDVFLILSPLDGQQQDCLMTLCAIHKTKHDAYILEGAVSATVRVGICKGVALINLPDGIIPFEDVHGWMIRRPALTGKEHKAIGRLVAASSALMPTVTSEDYAGNVKETLEQSPGYFAHVNVAVDFLSSYMMVAGYDLDVKKQEEDLAFDGAILSNAFKLTDPVLLPQKSGETETFKNVTLLQIDAEKDVFHVCATDLHSTVLVAVQVLESEGLDLWREGRILPKHQMLSRHFTKAFVQMQDRFGSMGYNDGVGVTMWRLKRAEMITTNGTYNYHSAHYYMNAIEARSSEKPRGVGLIVRAPMVPSYPNVFSLIQSAVGCSFATATYGELREKLNAARAVIEPIRPPKNSMDMTPRFPVALMATAQSASLVVPKDNVKGSSSRPAVFPLEGVRVTAPQSKYSHADTERFGVILDASILWDALESWTKLKGYSALSVADNNVVIGTDAQCSGNSPVVIFPRFDKAYGSKPPMTWAAFVQPLKTPFNVDDVRYQITSGYEVTSSVFDVIVPREDLMAALTVCETALGDLAKMPETCLMLWVDQFLHFNVMSAPQFTYGVNGIWRNLAPQYEMPRSDVVHVHMQMYPQGSRDKDHALVPFPDILRQVKGMKGRMVRIQAKATLNKNQAVGPIPKYICTVTDEGDRVTAKTDAAVGGVVMEHTSQPWQDRHVIASLIQQLVSAEDGFFSCRIEGDKLQPILEGVNRLGSDANFGLRQDHRGTYLWLYSQHGNDFAAGHLRWDGSECREGVVDPITAYATRTKLAAEKPLSNTGWEVQVSAAAMMGLQEAIKRGTTGGGKKRTYPNVRMATKTLKLVARVSDSEIQGALTPDRSPIKHKMHQGLSLAQDNALRKVRAMQPEFVRSGALEVDEAVTAGLLDKSVVDATRYGEMEALVSVLNTEGEGGEMRVTVWAALHPQWQDIGYRWLDDPSNYLGLAGNLWTRGYGSEEIQYNTLEGITQPKNVWAINAEHPVGAAACFRVSSTKLAELIKEAKTKFSSLGLTAKSGRIAFKLDIKGSFEAVIYKKGAVAETEAWTEKANLQELGGHEMGAPQAFPAQRWEMGLDELQSALAGVPKNGSVYFVLRRGTRATEHIIYHERSVTTTHDMVTARVQTLRPERDYGA